ncbi:MAG: HAD-IB family hydrolase [Polyangiaceae bacterium]|nr:HAD-IB family hydrolase [Polyangiaceae bacterium]
MANQKVLNSARPRAVFFDLALTLVAEISGRLYAQERRRRKEISRTHSLRIAWWLALYSVGLINAQKVATRALADYEGTSEQKMRKDCLEMVKNSLEPRIYPEARERVKAHLDAGDHVAILSAATPYIAQPIAHSLNIDSVLCTELEVDQTGDLTGRAHQPLCFGEGKVQKAKHFIEEHELSLAESYFYTDSITDRPLLELVNHPRPTNPDRRLRSLARRRGWPIEDWSLGASVD